MAIVNEVDLEIARRCWSESPATIVAAIAAYREEIEARVKAECDAEIARLRAALTLASVELLFIRMAIAADDPKHELALRCQDTREKLIAALDAKGGM